MQGRHEDLLAVGASDACVKHSSQSSFFHMSHKCQMRHHFGAELLVSQKREVKWELALQMMAW